MTFTAHVNFSDRVNTPASQEIKESLIGLLHMLQQYDPTLLHDVLDTVA